MRIFALACALLFACIAAPSCSANKLAVAGASTDVLGRTFLTTGATLDAAYDAHLLTEEEYAPWRTFSLRFKAVYGPLEDALEAAVEAKDDTVSAGITAVFTRLSLDLADFDELVVKTNAKDGGS